MKNSPELDPLAPHPDLDYSKGVRGKYSNLLKQGTNVAIIDPDLLDTFPDSKSINEALRLLKKLAIRRMQSSRKPPRKRT